MLQKVDWMNVIIYVQEANGLFVLLKNETGKKEKAPPPRPYFTSQI